MDAKDQPLKVELHGETISVTIGVSALAEAVLSRFNRSKVANGEISVPDEYALACATIMEMRRPIGDCMVVLGWFQSAAMHGAGPNGPIRFTDPPLFEGSA